MLDKNLENNDSIDNIITVHETSCGKVAIIGLTHIGTSIGPELITRLVLLKEENIPILVSKEEISNTKLEDLLKANKSLSPIVPIPEFIAPLKDMDYEKPVKSFEHVPFYKHYEKKRKFKRK